MRDLVAIGLCRMDQAVSLPSKAPNGPRSHQNSGKNFADAIEWAAVFTPVSSIKAQQSASPTQPLARFALTAYKRCVSLFCFLPGLFQGGAE